ncbi:MAG: hypothetical protein HC880_03765 [Bacteroidia bacterium]|nr:hypothetical protein [Bacteroidia bacterium]
MFGSRFNESGIIQRVGFGFNNLQEERQFTYPADSADFRFTFLDFITDCSYASNDFDISLAEGELTITRFDLDARIIAGLFEFTLAKPGCDTIRITEGRFDMKM